MRHHSPSLKGNLAAGVHVFPLRATNGNRTGRSAAGTLLSACETATDGSIVKCLWSIPRNHFTERLDNFLRQDWRHILWPTAERSTDRHGNRERSRGLQFDS